MELRFLPPPTKKMKICPFNHNNTDWNFIKHCLNTERANGDGVENRNTLNQHVNIVMNATTTTIHTKNGHSQQLLLHKQPIHHLELVLAFLNLMELRSLRLVNKLFYKLVTTSKHLIEQSLLKYSKVRMIKTPCIYNIKLFNKNMASILYKSYYNFIADNSITIDSNFELIDKDDIIPSNIYDRSQKRYFKQLQQIFDDLCIWNEMVSIIFNPKHFNKLCLFHDSTIFKAYSRLLSYNFISQFPNDIRSNQS